MALVLWSVMTLIAGQALVPSPLETAKELLLMLGEKGCWQHFSISFFRGIAGLLFAFLAGLIAGIPCGRSKSAMDILSPMVTAVQACPTIIWISLLMVWAGMGGVVPLVSTFVATFPVMFFNIAQGVACLDPRLFSMARLYRVSRQRTLAHLVLPGIAPFVLAGFAFSLGICWKVISMAEFIGSSTGVGSQIYWAYRSLDMPRLFSWAIILMALGVFIDASLIKPLRQILKTRGVGDVA